MQLRISTDDQIAVSVAPSPPVPCASEGPSAAARPPMTTSAPMYCEVRYDTLRKILVMSMLVGMADCSRRTVREPDVILSTARLCMTPASESSAPMMSHTRCGTARASGVMTSGL